MAIRIEQIDRASLNNLLATDDELKDLIGVNRSALIEKLSALTPEELTALGIESLAPTEHNHDDRYYTETEADTKFATKTELEQLGPGDMGTFIYDPDKDGVVVAAETANHVAWDNVSEKPNLLILSDDPSTEPYISNTDLLNGHPASYFAEASVVQTIGNNLNTHINDTDAHGLNTGIVNNPVFAFGANTIKHTGKVPVFPEIELKGQHYVNLLGKDGDFESVTPWSMASTSRELSATDKVFGNNGVKVTLNAGISGGSIYQNVVSKLVAGKYYFVSCYVKNGNCATGAFIRFHTDDVTKDSPMVAANSFTRVGIIVTPTDFDTATYAYLRVVLSGTELQYAFADGYMINEISASDALLTVEQLLVKYPYVESYGALINPYFENRRGNLVRNGNGNEGLAYWSKRNGDEVLTTTLSGISIVASAEARGVVQKIKLKANTDYYVSATIVSGDAAIRVYDTAYTTLLALSNETFNSGNFSEVYVYIRSNAATTVVFKEVMLIEGTAAPAQYIPCDLQRFAIEGQFTSDDKLIVKDGALSGELWWKHKTLFGKDFDWTFIQDYVGYKRIGSVIVPSVITSYSTVGDNRFSVVKHNGNVLVNNGTYSSADQAALFTDGLKISIADADTGWAETINPNNDEVKIFMNGWKAVNNNGTRYVAWVNAIDNSLPLGALQTTVSAAYTSGGATLTLASVVGLAVNDSFIVVSGGSYFFRNITAINGNIITLSSSIPVNVASGDVVFKCDNATNTTLAIWCKNNVAPKYEGYRLHYKLANPEPITDANVQVDGEMWSINLGDNYITVDSGMVLSEVANPYLVGGAYYLNRVDKGGVMLQNKAEAVLALYDSSVYDQNWMIYSDVTVAYGKGCASILTANYDANAIYTVDYQILKTLHAQSFDALSLKYGQDVFTAIDTIGKAVEKKQQHDNILDTLVDLSVYEEIEEVSFSGSFFQYAANSLRMYIYTPIIRKKAVPIITIKDMSVKAYTGAGGSVSLPNANIEITTKYFNNYIRIQINYTGTDTTLINYLNTYGGYALCKIIMDCRGRL